MAFPVVNGRVVDLNYAHEELNPLDYRAPDGSCRECGQAHITARHNCDSLRHTRKPAACGTCRAGISPYRNPPGHSLCIRVSGREPKAPAWRMRA